MSPKHDTIAFMDDNTTKRILGFPDEFWIAFVIMVGFFLKIIFDISTGYTFQARNLGMWTYLEPGQAHEGTLGVIQYLFENHRFPDFDPRTVSGFESPPLFHILCALFLDLFHRAAGWKIGTCLHTLQCFNAIFVTAGSLSEIGILRKCGLVGRELVASILFMTFFPAFYIMGASFSAEAMCFMFCTFALNNAITWYRTKEMKHITRTAVFFGLGMSTSYAASAILPAILSFMILAVRDKRFGRKNNKAPYKKFFKAPFKRFFIIAGIGALWWPVYNLIRFGVPLFYRKFSYESWEMLKGRYSVWMRIKLPSINEFSDMQIDSGGKYLYNIWAQTLKTAIFDYNAINMELRVTYIMAGLLLFMNILLCVLFHVMWIRSLMGHRMKREVKVFTGVGYLGALIGYAVFCLRNPIVSAMNFCFIPTIILYPITGMAICGAAGRNATGLDRILTRVCNWVIVIFAVVAAFLFGYYAA